MSNVEKKHPECRPTLRAVKMLDSTTTWRGDILRLVVVAACWGAFCNPLAGAAERYSVRDFEAKANGVTDDGPAIKRAVEKGVQAGAGTKIFFPAGTYRVLSPIVIQNAVDLTIEGEPGALIVMADANLPIINIRNCRRLTIRSLSFDRNPLSFTQGTIEAVSPKRMTCDVRIDAGYQELDVARLRGVNEIHPFVFPESGTYQLDRNWPEIAARERTAERKWRLKLKGWAPTPAWAGKRFVLCAGGRGHCFEAIGLEDCLIEDVNYWGGGANAGFYLVDLSGTITFRRFVIGVPPGSDRMLSCAGGGQISDVRGKLLFDECDFSRIDDDGLDILGNWVRVLRQTGPRTIVVQQDYDFRPGDHVAIWDWDLKASRDQAVIVSVSKVDEHAVGMTFDREVRVKRVGPGNGEPFGHVPMSDGIDRVINLDTVGEQTTIRDCKFQVFRAKCLNLKAKNCLVEGCTFSQSWQPAVSAAPEWYFQEGPPVRNLVVRNNTFKNINHTNIQIGVDSSESRQDKSARETSRDTVGVSVEGNRFTDFGAHESVFAGWPPGSAIRVQCAKDVIIRNNDFADPASSAPKGVEKLIIENSDNVVVEENRGLPKGGGRSVR